MFDLEKYIIPDTIACEKISLSGLFQKLSKPFNKHKSESISNNKYSQMSDRDLAKRLISGLRMNKVKPLDDSDENTKTSLYLTTELASGFGQKYEIYRFDNALVLVIQKDDPNKTEFNVWCNVPGYGNNKLISTPKDALIKSFINEDK